MKRNKRERESKDGHTNSLLIDFTFTNEHENNIYKGRSRLG